MARETRNWIAPDGSRYKGEWSHPSVLLLMGVLPPRLYKRAHSSQLQPDERRTLRFFRGTGEFIGKDARLKDRERKDQNWDTCMVLRARGLLEHSWCDRWYLTEQGREFLRGGKDV